MSTVTISDEGLGSVGVSETVETVVVDDGAGPPGPPGPPGPGGAGDLLAANNLSDLDDEAAARANLGLGDVATHPATDFANAADLIAEQSERITTDQGLQAEIDSLSVGGGTGDMLGFHNLSELTNIPTARDNLGLGSAAVEDVAAFATPADVTNLTDALGTGAFRNVGAGPDDLVTTSEVNLDIAAIPTVDTTDNAKAFFITEDVGGGEEVTFLDVSNLASLDDIVAGGGGAADAAHLPFTPNGSISATDVQAAIEEVRDEAGSGTAFSFAFTQDVSSALWSVAHNLGGYPNVTVVDSLVRQIEADVQYVDTNNLTVGFATATTGQAFLS